jgi:hypothetical protein
LPIPFPATQLNENLVGDSEAMKREHEKSIVFQALYQQHKASQRVMLLSDYSVWSNDDIKKGEFEATPLGMLSLCKAESSPPNCATLVRPDGSKQKYLVQAPKCSIDFKKGDMDGAIGLFHLLQKAAATSASGANIKLNRTTVALNDMKVVIPCFVNTKAIKKHSLLQHFTQEGPESKKPRHG